MTKRHSSIKVYAVEVVMESSSPVTVALYQSEAPARSHAAWMMAMRYGAVTSVKVTAREVLVQFRPVARLPGGVE